MLHQPMTIRDLSLAFVAASLWFAGATAAAEPPRLIPTVIPALPGGNTQAHALNDSGVVTGESGGPSPADGFHAFAWSRGAEIVRLAPSASASVGQEINNAGQIAGVYALTPSGQMRPFIHTPESGLVDLGIPPGALGDVVDLNESGTIVGAYTPDGWIVETFIYDAGAGLAVLDGLDTNWVRPWDIADSGEVVGYYWASGGYGGVTERGFRWTPESGAVDVGTLGGMEARPYYVNSTGTIVGDSLDESGTLRPFVMQTAGDAMQEISLPAGASEGAATWVTETDFILGTFLDAYGSRRAFYCSAGDDDVGVIGIDMGGTPDARIVSANAQDETILNRFNTATQSLEPYYFTPATGAHDLNDLLTQELPFALTAARDINAAGQILAYGFDGAAGRHRSVLLDPVNTGDLNCDGALNGFDIDAFVLALTDPAAYVTALPRCSVALADVNDDGVVDGLDIDPFVQLVVGQD